MTDREQTTPPVAYANRFHRIRFNRDAWSTFDQVEPCNRPGPCAGCQFGHPVCNKHGRVELTDAE